MIPEHLSPPRTWLISFFFRARSVILNAIAGFLLTASVVWMALMIYGSFYYFYMGLHLKDFELKFSFTPCNNDESRRCSILYSDPLPSFGEYVSSLSGGDYSISLELRMPPSEGNLRHGMFMCCLNLSKDEEDPLCRGALFPYKSQTLRSLESTIFLPFYMLGIFGEEVSTVSVLFLEKLPGRMEASHPRVSLLSRSLDVSSGVLRVHPRLWGLRYLLYHHHLISSFLVVSLLSLIIGSLLCALWVNILTRICSRGPSTPLVPRGRREKEE